MKLKTWMTVKAIICIVFGLGFVILPSFVMNLYDVNLGKGGVYMTRLLGQAFILLSLLLWLVRNTDEAATRRAFALAVLVGDLIGFIITLQVQLAGSVNALGWVTVAIYLVFTLGFGYFLLPGNE